MSSPWSGRQIILSRLRYLELCEAIAALAGPILDAQRREDRWLSAKVAEALHTQLGRLCGPRYVGRKLVVLALLALATFFAMFQADYRVAATTVLEPEVRRAVLAPFEGYIADAPRRAGELVGVERCCVRWTIAISGSND